MERRYRLCTSTDRNALTEEMAAGALKGAGYGGKWEDVHTTWSVGFSHHADLLLHVQRELHDR